jgi:DNA-binding response OmpR family regulator
VGERNLDTNFRVELKRIYLEESDGKVRALKGVMKNYLREPGIPSNLADFIEVAHKLAGAGATYGFPVISEIGGSMESLRRALRGGDVELIDDVRNALARAVKSTEDVFAKAKEGREAVTDDYPVIREMRTLAKQPEERATEPQNDKKTILVVDDDADSLRITNLTLTKAGYKVLSYVTGEDVRVALKTERPDLLILDVMLPGMSGYDLCREIRKDKAFTFTPVVYVTTKGQIDDKVFGLKTGADDYLTKPYEPEELVARVGAHIGRIELMKELSIKDGLTRAFNHRYFQERLATELGRARRYGRALSLALVDIDHFKRFNDQWGHQVGDVVLRRLVDTLHQPPAGPQRRRGLPLRRRRVRRDHAGDALGQGAGSDEQDSRAPRADRVQDRRTRRRLPHHLLRGHLQLPRRRREQGRAHREGGQGALHGQEEGPQPRLHRARRGFHRQRAALSTRWIRRKSA